MNHSIVPTFDPGLRSSIELLYGPEPAAPGEIRGETVRGRARYSSDEAIRAATRALLPRLGDDLRVFARRRPSCRYAHAATSATCRAADCQAWMNQVVAWHAKRFGARHFDISLGAVLWMSTGRSLSLEVSDGQWRDAYDPATVALDLGVNRAWVTTQIGIHASASKADLHDLVDRLWPEVERLRRIGGLQGRADRRSNGRTGRVDRPARATYWRFRQVEGLSLAAIADEWERLTRTWTALRRGGGVDRHRTEYPAWLEWRRRGHAAGIERFEEVGTVQRAIAKLRKLTA